MEYEHLYNFLHIPTIIPYFYVDKKFISKNMEVYYI